MHHPARQIRDDPDDDINRKIEYKDEELSSEELALVNTMRDQLGRYNKLLKHTFIDIPSYTPQPSRGS